MLPQDFRDWLHREPFRPFRLHVLEVTTYEVRHPELAVVNAASVDLFFPPSDQLLPTAEQRVTIDVLAISRLETIATKPAALGNGA